MTDYDTILCNSKQDDLAFQVKQLWTKHKIEIEKRLDGWLTACQHGEKAIIKAKKQFHQWDPLRIYVSVGKAKSKNDFTFSLRFYGQEVAVLIIKNENVKLKLSKRNCNFFEGFPLEPGEYPWDGKDAKAVRSFFKRLSVNSNRMPKLKSEEHRIESKVIREMLKSKGKFSRHGLQIQPVTLGCCPLQFPVPFSANTGIPKIGTGYIDILARRKGKDSKVRLSVWELKRPEKNAYKKAASQAYIYAYTLLLILRHDKRWYKLFGFNSKIPASIEIEAVVGISCDQKSQFEKERIKLQNNTAFEINGDRIKLYPAYYTEKPDAIVLDKNSLEECQ